jgi:hypothetical protein
MFGGCSTGDWVYSVYATYTPDAAPAADPTVDDPPADDPPSPQMVGNDSVLSYTNKSSDRRAMPFVMPEDGEISSVSLYHEGGGGNMLLGVYGDNGSGRPGARIAVTAETAVNDSEGWQTVYLTEPAFVTAGQTIWLAWVFEVNPGVRYDDGTPGRASSGQGWSAGMPAMFGGCSTGDWVYSIYATYTSGGPATGGGLVLLSEDFSDGDHNGWSILTEAAEQGPADWYVDNGWLVQGSNVFSYPAAGEIEKPGTYALYPAGAAWGDYRLSALVSSDDDDAIGIMFRYQDNDNYYRFSMDRQRKYRRLVKKVNGQYYLLAGDDFRYAKGQSYRVEVIAEGSSIEVYMDGELAFSVIDDSIAQGALAMYCWGNAGSLFDDILAEKL